MDVNERKILVFTSAAHGLTHFYVLIFPALVMPLSRHFALEASEIIRLSFPMYFCYGALAIPWGFLSDRFDARHMMSAGLLLSGFGLILGAIVDQPTKLSLALGLVGVGCSAYHPCGLALISKGIRVRGKAMGINGAWGNFGIAISPLLTGTLCYSLGYKTALLLFGLSGVVLGAFCFVFRFSAGKQDLQKSSAVEMRQAVPLFMILCVAMVFSGLMYRGYTVILPTYFESKLSSLGGFIMNISGSDLLSNDQRTFWATTITFFVYIIGMVGQLLGGKAADTYDLRKAYLMFFVCAAPFLLLLKLVQGPLIVICVALFVLFALGMQPVENSLVASLTPAKWRSVSYGIKFTAVFGAGSISVQLVSIVEGNYGIDSVVTLLILLLGLVISSIATMLWMSRGMKMRHEN